jgi:hypothetical protein
MKRPQEEEHKPEGDVTRQPHRVRLPGFIKGKYSVKTLRLSV